MHRLATAAGFCAALLAASGTSPARATVDELPPVKQTALDEAAALDTEIARLSATLWEYSEIALEEERSAALLADTIERAGFRVKRGVAGMPTAFVAE